MSVDWPRPPAKEVTMNQVRLYHICTAVSCIVLAHESWMMAANGQIEKCCLCLSPIDDTTFQHKWKKLYGAGSSEARRVLEKIRLECT